MSIFNRTVAIHLTNLLSPLLFLHHIIVLCPIIETLSNGMVSYSPSAMPLVAGTVATYTCDTGYTLVGASTRTCSVDGDWITAAPTCLRELCICYKVIDKVNVFITHSYCVCFSVAVHVIYFPSDFHRIGNLTCLHNLRILIVSLSSQISDQSQCFSNGWSEPHSHLFPHWRGLSVAYCLLPVEEARFTAHQLTHPSL